MTDAEFLAAFESCALPAEQWTHQAHVRVAYLYASRHELSVAIERMRTSIKKYNAATDTPEKIDRGYHETITVAFMQLVFVANVQTGPHESSADFYDSHPELQSKFALRNYYSKDRIMTLEAKRDFVEPNLCPLPFSATADVTIHNAVDIELVEHARTLFTEYLAALPHNLSYQHFDEELQSLPGKYASPNGRLLVAFNKEQPAGCVAIRPIDDNACEMKRLWVRPAFRRSGLGKLLVKTAVDHAESIGYHTMRLDTVTDMTAAVALYRSLGFVETTAFTYNPFPDAIYMEKPLSVDKHSERK